MKWLIYIVFFINTPAYSQTIYKSLLTEYSYKTGNFSSYEWIKREIYINKDIITIISTGEKETDIQKWKINHWEKIIDTYTSNFIYYTSLFNSPDNTDLPAIFRVIENEDGLVEIIEWEIPLPNNLNALPRLVRFHID